MNVKPPNYNLLVEQWIPVLMTDGKYGRVGIRDALTQAGRIRQIAASNPMDNVALLRLLLAVLQWCKPSLADQERDALEGAVGIPEDWVRGKLGVEGEDSPAFNLLGRSARFFQDQTQSGEAPNRRVSDLFAYLPADTEINHFRHVQDRTVALCPACCAVGLVRLSACAMQGGQGKSPSINNAPPVYFLPVGDSLFGTLELGWPLQGEACGDHPAWEAGGSSGGIGILEGFTWQPRAVWLGPLVEHAGRTCARCGAGGPLISELVFKKGRSRKGDGRAWRDPHVAWPTTMERAGEERPDPKDSALRGPDPLKYPGRDAALWRRTVRAVLESAGEGPRVLAIGNAYSRRRLCSDLGITCFEPFTKQAKCFDEHRDGWRIPSGLLPDGLRTRALGALGALESFDLSQCLRASSTRSRPPVGLESAGAITAADTQRRLCECFRRLVNGLAEADASEDPERCVERWRDEIRGVFQEVLDRMCPFTTAGSPLRRREAAQRARQALDEAMAELIEAGAGQPAADAAGQPKRGRRKGGRA